MPGWSESIFCATAEETEHLGFLLARERDLPSVFALKGMLGAGKTTFIRGFVRGRLGEEKAQEVGSPTFVFLHIYEGEKPLYHFDLYRLSSPQEFLNMGFDDFFLGEVLVEWAEKIESWLPSPRVEISLEVEGEGRKVTFTLR